MGTNALAITLAALMATAASAAPPTREQIQASRDHDVQAPRGQAEIQAPRGDEPQAPRR